MSATDSQRGDLEIEQIISDIRLKNRQHTTEVWKVAIAAIVAGAVIGGLAVQIANLLAA